MTGPVVEGYLPYPLEAMHHNGSAALLAEAMRDLEKKTRRMKDTPRGPGSDIAASAAQLAHHRVRSMQQILALVYGVPMARIETLGRQWMQRDRGQDRLQLNRLQGKGLGNFFLD